MCIWDSCVYQKGALCFLIHKSYVRSIKYIVLAVSMLRFHCSCIIIVIICLYFAKSFLLEQWIPNLWIYDYKITFSAYLIAFLYLRSTRRFLWIYFLSLILNRHHVKVYKIIPTKAMLQFCTFKTITLTNSAHFPRLCYHMLLQDHIISSNSVTQDLSSSHDPRSFIIDFRNSCRKSRKWVECFGSWNGRKSTHEHTHGSGLVRLQFVRSFNSSGRWRSLRIQVQAVHHTSRKLGCN